MSELTQRIQEVRKDLTEGLDVEVRKDHRTGYFIVSVGGMPFVDVGDAMYKRKAEAVRLAKERHAKGKWYVFTWRKDNRYRKENAESKGFKTRSQADKAAEKLGSEYVTRWVEN